MKPYSAIFAAVSACFSSQCRSNNCPGNLAASRPYRRRRDHRAGALCAEHLARHAEHGRCGGQGCSGLRHHCQAPTPPAGARRIPRAGHLQVRPHGRGCPSRQGRAAEGALRHHRHVEILSRLRSVGEYLRSGRRTAKRLLDMEGWEQAQYNHKDGTAQLANDFRPTDPSSLRQWAQRSPRPTTSTTTAWARTRRASSTTAATPCTAGTTTLAPAAPSTCVPFMVTNKGYGLLWDNPSKTTIEPGFNEQTKWTSEVGDRVSFFVIAGKDDRRDLRRLQAAHRTHAHAAQGGLRLHPVQAAILKPGRGDGRGQGLPRPPSARRRRSSSTGSTTPRWARWTWTPSTGPIPRR